jgi:DNA-binding LytR/AlgR family response regulator
MPSLSGLEMLKTLNQAPKVILTTAFSEFGVESYEYGITDYLLKPIAFDRFLKAINKILVPAKAVLSNEQSPEKPSSEPSFIFFKANKKIHKYYLSDILYIEGSGNYIKVHTQNDKPLIVLDKLTELLEKLPQKQFIRVHKSYIVNISYVQNIEGNVLKIKDTVIPISATFRQNLDRIIKENAFLATISTCSSTFIVAFCTFYIQRPLDMTYLSVLDLFIACICQILTTRGQWKFTRHFWCSKKTDDTQKELLLDSN